MSELEPGQEEIIEATYRALKRHGYSDLTIQDIADEFDKSKSLLYYHYDGKETLFADVLQYTTHKCLDELQRSGETPGEQLTRRIRVIVDQSGRRGRSNPRDRRPRPEAESRP